MNLETLKFHRPDLGILMLLQKLKHPFAIGAEDHVTVETRDILSAVFVFSDPEKAHEAFLDSEAEFWRQVFALGRAIRPDDLPALAEQLQAAMNDRAFPSVAEACFAANK